MVPLGGDEPATTQVQERVMDEFERHAFPGMRRGVDFDILWVRHTETHAHLHFISPRIHLRSRRSLNCAPPGSQKYFELLRTKLNLELNLHDPTDPARAQAVRLPKHLARLRRGGAQKSQDSQLDIREIAARHVLAKVRDGSATNRDDVSQALRAAGLSVCREGNNYVTIIHPETNRRVRLRGRLFERGAVLRELVSRPLVPNVQNDPKRLQEVSDELE